MPLERLCARAQPDASVPDWLLTGAPAGVALAVPADGIFPPLDEEADLCPTELCSVEEFSNYQGVEADGHAEEEIRGFLAKGYLRGFDSSADLEAFLGAPPI